MGTSTVRCCSAKEAQTADTKVEAAGEEMHVQLPEDIAPKSGAQSAADVVEEASDKCQQEGNAEPDSEPLTDSAAEKQSEEKREEDFTDSCETPAPEFEASAPMPEGEEIEKNEVEPTAASSAAELPPAEEKGVTEKGEETAKKKELSSKVSSKEKKESWGQRSQQASEGEGSQRRR
mmetsp:Transcript_41088/g.65133  ORF Transcript_41088/g.65133 Transcript_41088/m.65133 type:complete len:177 (+) Transcript_41088:26-556(+)